MLYVLIYFSIRAKAPIEDRSAFSLSFFPVQLPVLFRMAPSSVVARLMSLSATIAAIALSHGLFSSCEAVEPERTLADRMTLATLNTSSFWAIADVPYTAKDRVILEARLKVLGTDADFLVHLGDIKSGTSVCNQAVIDQMDALMKSSPVPVLMVIGDNEFNDCTKPRAALTMWRRTFAGYAAKYWSPKFVVTQMPNRPEVFSFVNKETLYIGLNLVGGLVHDLNEWNTRHAAQLAWIQPLMLAHASTIHSVVLFGHSDPGANHASFINPFVIFLRTKFPTTIPVLYLCGDAHKWGNNTAYRNVPNWFRVRLTGGVKEKINKITVDPYRLGIDKSTAFQVDRYLV